MQSVAKKALQEFLEVGSHVQIVQLKIIYSRIIIHTFRYYEGIKWVSNNTW